MAQTKTLARSAAFGVACALLFWGFLRGAGDAAAEATLGAGPLDVLLPAVLSLASFAGLVGAVFFLRRGPRSAFVVLLAALWALAIPWELSTTAGIPTLYPMPERDRLSWWPPNSTQHEQSPRLPQVSYVSNADGFRGAAPGPKAPETLRIQVIGDSFVFGMGLEPPDTLPAQLERLLRARHPGRNVEVVNLGVPGNNLLGHVTLYERVGERFAADATVLCITDNDLANWTPQGLQPQAYQLGFFSAVSFLVGPKAARLAWAGMYALPDGSPEERESARRLLERAAANAAREQKPLVIYAFPPKYADLVAEVNGRPWVVAAASREDDLSLTFFFEFDGHPTAEGDAYFAARIADLIDQVPRLAPQLGSPKP